VPILKRKNIMAAKMIVKKFYWSRRPGEYLDIHTGAVDNSKPDSFVVIGD